MQNILFPIPLNKLFPQNQTIIQKHWLFYRITAKHQLFYRITEMSQLAIDTLTEKLVIL